MYNLYVITKHLFQGLMDVTDKFLYEQLIAGKEDDSFYKGYQSFLLSYIGKGIYVKNGCVEYSAQTM